MPSLRTLGVFKCWEWPQTWILCSLLCMCHVIAVSIHCKPGDTVVLRSQKNITVSEKDDVRWIFKSNRNNESLPRKGLSNGSLKIPPLRNEDISGIYELEIFYMTGQSKTKENFSLTVADNSERSLECKEETECLQSNICSCCIPPNQNRGYVITLVAVAAFVTLSLVTFFVMVARQRQKKPNAEKNDTEISENPYMEMRGGQLKQNSLKKSLSQDFNSTYEIFQPLDVPNKVKTGTMTEPEDIYV